MVRSGTGLYHEPVIHDRQQNFDAGRPGGNQEHDQVLGGYGGAAGSGKEVRRAQPGKTDHAQGFIKDCPPLPVFSAIISSVKI